jgi:PAS domain S-box-containing protein
MTGGLLCLALGAAIMAAWLTRATAILRFGNSVPMAFNTAFALAVTGVALVLVAASGSYLSALAAGAFDAVLGLLVLAEYALGRGLGIDELVVRAYLSGPQAVPGRMADDTAVCFVLAGLGLLACALLRSRLRQDVAAGAAILVAAIAIISLFGDVARTRSAYGWGWLSSMDYTTAAAMIVLSVSLHCIAWRGTELGADRLPRWRPVSAGMMALGLFAAVWAGIVGSSARGGRVDAGLATEAATVTGLLTGSMVILVIELAQWAETRSRLARAEALRAAEAEARARASEHRTFQFLAAIPVGVMVNLPDGQPYFVNQEAEGMLGQGVVPGVSADRRAETYNLFVAGTSRHYPTDSLPSVHAAHGRRWHADDIEVHRRDGLVVPVESWSAPITGPGGEVEFTVTVLADMAERNARGQVIAAQAALLDLAHDAILVRDREGRITYWSVGAERTYGYARSDAIGRLSHELLQTQFPVPIADIEATAVRDGRWDGELTHRCADGRTIVVASRWAVQLDPNGNVVRLLEINTDITAKKAAERELSTRTDEIRALNSSLELQVRERTAYLERANRNLETFTRSVAHDLRAPLRAMSGFAEALVEDYGDRLPGEGRDYAERIQAASQRMGALLDDLLHLSRLSRAELHLEPVDLSAEATTIAGELRAEQPGRRVSITIQPGVLVIADRNLIRTVLQNLIENAWKFTARREEGSIEFGTVPGEDAEVCCFVRDNGAGFDPAYAGKLFQTFQRLHSEAEFPGNGIGLASVRQIVERHGGRAWAEGTVGGGATFYFTLNARPSIPSQAGPVSGVRPKPASDHAARQRP